MEKRELCISFLFSSGIPIFASPGAQVGATWAKKSGPNAPKVASQRDQGSKVCLVGSILLNEMDRTANQPELSQGKAESPSNRQDI